MSSKEGEILRQMKDSGVEWLGKIPHTWEIQPNKRVMRKAKNICEKYQGESVLSLTMNGVIARDLDNPSGKMPLTFDGYQYISKGNLLMCLFDIDVTPRCVGVINDDGVTSPAYSQFYLLGENLTRYFYYYYLNLDYSKELLHLAKNLRHSLTESQLGEVYVPVPPIEDQRNIVFFLDKKCAQIDDLISRQQESIEKLKAYKLSVISEAVTKGLNPDTPMCDSGIEWLGCIPAHWEFRRTKSMAKIVDCKNRTPENKPDGEYTVVRTTCIKDGKFSYEGSFQTDEENYIIWTERGAPMMGDVFFTREAPMGEACMVPDADNLCMGQRVMYFRPFDDVDGRFVLYSIYGPLVREYIESKSKGSTVGHLKLGQVADLPMLYCPYEEQQQICNYLDRECEKIEVLIQRKQVVIERLIEYKKSLIYEVVTGKREVP